jgi:D-serine deaminase-like pyridoxal phosphate-dependent protein
VLVNELATPQVLVDRERLMKNIDRVQRLADAAGIALRPHAKTHKSPVIARWQLDRGATGICCAKLGEAEVFAGAGIRDIRLAYPINPTNATRLLP